MSRRTRAFLYAAVLSGTAALLLVACAEPITPNLVITSVKEGTDATLSLSRDLSAPAFTYPGTENAQCIVSGAPEYIKVTLKKIGLTYQGEDMARTAWEGSQVLTVDGAGAMDTGAITLDVTAGTITAVELTFAPVAQIKGSILGKTMTTSAGPSPTTAVVDVYTKADYAWDAASFAAGGSGGGATGYASFGAGPAEEMDISLSTSTADLVVTTASSAVIAAGDAPVLTVLFDLSRVLRFYNGLRGTDGTDGIGTTSAYFYAFTTFASSTAAFIGEAGSVQGYESRYNGYEDGDTANPALVLGWMTLVFDGAGSYLSGMLVGDSDTDWTVSKGAIGSYAVTGGIAEIGYTPGGSDTTYLHGFVAQSTVGEYTPLATWDVTGTGYSRDGEAYFVLRLQEP